MVTPAESLFDQARDCALCGSRIPVGAPFGQCPKCLLSLGSHVKDPVPMGEDLLHPAQVRNFGDYELLEELARGGMGVVYRARQLSLGREVAVKMILAGELANAESVQRFRNEAAAAAQLDHPHIVPVYEIGEHETQHFFSMRLVLGRRNIAGWTKENEPRATGIAAMMAKVARAVAFAHERGVLHRDLKPPNILVDEKGEPQVTDFGLAKLVNHDSGLTASVAMLGSPSYMAPEQADGRHRDVTTATDVYGLGAVLYELLAGRPPFIGASPLATLKLVVEQMPERLRGVSRDLETLCLKCLAKEPSQRYVSALAVAEDLERFASGQSILARPLTGAESLWRWARRKPAMASLLAAIVLVFLAGFAGVTWQWWRAEKSLNHLRWFEIVRQAEGEEAPVAVARLARKLRADPDNWQAAMLAMSVADQRPFPVPAGAPVHPEVKLTTEPELSAEGSWFTAGAEDGTLRVWDTATGKERAPVKLGSPAVALAAGQGAYPLASATQEGRVLLCGPDKVPRPLPRSGSEPVVALAFSGDGSHLLARGKVLVELWACARTEESPRVFSLEGGIAGASLSGDGGRLLAWNARRAAVFDSQSGSLVREVTPRSTFLQGHLAGNGSRFSLIDGRFVIRSWDVASGEPLADLDSGVTLWGRLFLNADGSRLVALSSGNELLLFDPVSGLKTAPPMLHFYRPMDLAISGDGRRFASSGQDGRSIVWDFATGLPVVEAVWHDAHDSAHLSLSQDGCRLLVRPRTVRGGTPDLAVWQAAPTRPPRSQGIPGSRDLLVCSLSPDGKLGALGLCPESGTLVYEIASGRAVLEAATKSDVYAHLFSPDQTRYYALTANGWLHGWSLATGKELWTPEQQPGKIRPAAISPDGSRIVAGHSDGHLRIYDTATGRQVQALDHPGETKVVRFAPDGSGRFVSGSTDAVAHVWDLATGKKLASFTGHAQTIIAASWSPDGGWVATGSYDQSAQIWDAATGETVGAPMRHLAWLSHLEFSPDGSRLATGCRGGTARLWYPRSGRPASAPLPQASTVVTVRFTPDSRALLVRDHEGFRFWGVEKAEPLTPHFSAPMSSGVGMDAETWRAILSPDGSGVFLGHSMNEGQYWTVPQPRHSVPEWFPGFLEQLAGMREGETGDVELLPAGRRPEVPASATGEYADWARGVVR